MACQLDISGSSMSHPEGTTVATRAMLSVRGTEIATQGVLPQFEQCSCSLLQTILYRSKRTLCCCFVSKCQTSDRERPVVWCYQLGDGIDLKSSAEYPQLKSHARSFCAACSVTPGRTVQLGTS